MIYDYVFSGVSCLPQLRYIEPVAACLLHFFEFRPGKVKTIEGVDTCRSIPAVIDIALEFEGGDLISPANDDRSRQGYVIIKGVDIGFIENQVELINDTIKVGYE
jgi:hypothetical protein